MSQCVEASNGRLCPVLSHSSASTVALHTFLSRLSDGKSNAIGACSGIQTAVQPEGIHQSQYGTILSAMNLFVDQGDTSGMNIQSADSTLWNKGTRGVLNAGLGRQTSSRAFEGFTGAFQPANSLNLCRWMLQMCTRPMRHAKACRLPSGLDAYRDLHACR